MLDNVRDSLVTAYYDNTNLLDAMLGIDNFLENTANVYAYPNWFEGEVVAGPAVKRYWATIVLKYDFKNMPDPDGGQVLVRLGCKVFYKKFKQKVKVNVEGPGDFDSRHRPKTTTEPCWLVKIIIPKKFLEDKKLKDLELEDNDIDVEQIENGLNAGLETNGEMNAPAEESQMGLPGQTPT